MIQEYRKKSAEVLGIQLTKYGIILGSQHPIKGLKSIIQLWNPESDANQMLMVWEWLRKNVPYSITLHEILASIFNEFIAGVDIKLATMKAFMEYIKNN